MKKYIEKTIFVSILLITSFTLAEVALSVRVYFEGGSIFVKKKWEEYVNKEDAVKMKLDLSKRPYKIYEESHLIFNDGLFVKDSIVKGTVTFIYKDE